MAAPVYSQLTKTDAAVIDESSGNVFSNNGGTMTVHHGHVYQNQTTVVHQTSSKPVLRRCPAPSVYYTPRPDIEDKLTSYFFDGTRKQHIFVLYGSGGSGKSELAFAFVDRYYYSSGPGDTRFSHVYYVDATSVETATKSLENIAAANGLDATSNNALFWLANQGGETGNWMIIYNNANDPSIDLRGYFPSCNHGNILVTTRYETAKVLQVSMGSVADQHITWMKETEALDVLLKNARLTVDTILSHELDIAKALILKLGYRASAIGQAGAYMATKSCGIEEYSKIYDQSASSLAEAHRQDSLEGADNSDSSAYSAWLVNYKDLSPSAQKLLQICAFLHHDNISEPLFKAMYEGMPNYKPVIPFTEAEQQAYNLGVQFVELFKAKNGWSSDKFQAIIEELKSYSLLSENENVFMIHPLIHSWAFTVCTDIAITQISVALLISSTIKYQYLTVDYSWRRTLVVHLDTMLSRKPDLYTDSMMRMGLVYLESGVYKEAERMYRAVLCARTELLGAHHPDTLAALSRVAELERKQYNYKEAKRLELQRLEAIKVLHGDKHPESLSAMVSLAALYSNSGNWSKSAPLEEEVVELRKQSLGEKHPHTLLVMGNLAESYNNLGKLSEAEAILLNILSIRKISLGRKHPQTLRTMLFLANTYKKMNQMTKAIDLGLEVFIGRKNVLGEQHPDTLIAMTNLALAYKEQGNYSEAITLQQQALHLRVLCFGEKHDISVRNMVTLAEIYDKKGDWSKSEEIWTQVVKIRQEKLGNQHANTLYAMACLAAAHRWLGNLSQAEKLEVDVLKARKETLGNNHAHTYRAMANLAQTYQKQNKWPAAGALWEPVVTYREQTLGKEHKDTLFAMVRLAIAYWNQNMLSEAESIEKQVMNARINSLGENHKDTITAMSNLAYTYKSMGRLSEGIELAERVLELRIDVLGDEHVDTITSRKLLTAFQDKVTDLAKANGQVGTPLYL